MRSISSAIQFTDEQIRQLIKLKNAYQARLGHNVADLQVWFGTHLTIYLSALALEAEGKSHGLKIRPSTTHRRASVRAFATYLGRKPSGDDIIEELSRIVAVPDFIADVIRRDVQQLQR